MWHLAYAEGDPVVGDAIELEYHLGWEGEPEALVVELEAAGFLDRAEDGQLVIHDLYDNAPKYVLDRLVKEMERRGAKVGYEDIRDAAHACPADPVGELKRRHVAAPAPSGPRHVGATSAPRRRHVAAAASPPAPSPSPTPTPTPTPTSECVSAGAGTAAGARALLSTHTAPEEVPEDRSWVTQEPTLPLPRWSHGSGIDPPWRCAAGVLTIMHSIRGRPVLQRRVGADANRVLQLWKALDRPPIEELVEDVQLVAAAARASPDPKFARDLRAEGWPEGRDRSSEVVTICDPLRWGDRLEAATRWREQEDRATRQRPGEELSVRHTVLSMLLESAERWLAAKEGDREWIASDLRGRWKRSGARWPPDPEQVERLRETLQELERRQEATG